MYDVIVVGARCAGSPTAMLLARKGHRVLLVDRAAFPSDTMSTHLVWPPGVAQIKQWGLLDDVRSSNCPPIRSGTIDFGDFVLQGWSPPANGVAEGYCPRRRVLDKLLVEAAVAAGAELRELFSVKELLWDDGRVAGVRGAGKAGSQVTEEARIVIGADGLRSMVAREVGAQSYHSAPTLSCGYYAYWSGVPFEGIEFYPRDNRAIGLFPTNDGLVCIYVAWTNQEFHEYRADLERNYLATLELAPGLAERVRQGKREERFVGTADLRNMFRRSHGPGWALVGDAAYHKDPITAQGISDAFWCAELLAEAIDEGLAGGRTFKDALADYEKRRDEHVRPIFEITCQIASLRPLSPEQQQFFAAMRGNQEAIDGYLGALAGTVPVGSFFSPENVQRIVSAAAPG